MRTLFFNLFLLCVVALSGQRREVHILSVNDVHATLEYMPQLAAIADSLRASYPSLLVLSAGDNRTGNPLNDKYNPSGYPMVAMMNQIGFDASAVGNHDFDMMSLPRLSQLSHFSYLCANLAMDSMLVDKDSLATEGLYVRPYKVFDVDGLRVGIIGTVQVGQLGRPDTHPDNLVGLRFEDPVECVRRHEWFSRQCDVTILLSHAGYRADTLAAHACPWLDLIVGGHSHKQLDSSEVIGGIPITQNSHRLYHATHITIVCDSGRVTDRQVEYIDVRNFSQKSTVVENMLHYYSESPFFRQVLATAATPFNNIYELGCIVCDALIECTEADVSLYNHRGIRMQYLPAGDITVRDVLTMDPFGNNACILVITGKELYNLIKSYSRMEINHFPHLGGFKAKVTVSKDNPETITDFKLFAIDGSPLKMKRTYRVVTNSYVSAASRAFGISKRIGLNSETADMIMDFLKRRGTVDYQGVNRIVFQ